jgi:hypothetical protein
MTHSTTPSPRARTVVSRGSNGQPRTYRLASPASRAAYRRLTAAILGLDVATLTDELRSVRRSVAHLATAAAHVRLAPAA